MKKLSIYILFCLWSMSVEAVSNVQVMGIPLHTYHPRNCSLAGLLFVFHGQQRNAKEYRTYARSYAQDNCLIIIAPEFNKQQFPNWRYQRGGIIYKDKIIPPEQWTVNQVRKIIQWSQKNYNALDLPYYIFGHSAGGQFLSRLAAFAPPEDVKRIVIANASSYVSTEPDEDIPYGFNGLFSRAVTEKKLQAYLSLPITIYLGGRDTGSKSLHNHPAALRQGKNRLQRGINIFNQAKALAYKNSWLFNWCLVIAPDIAHSARQMLHSKHIKEAFAPGCSE